MVSSLTLLALLWSAWCFFHSLLITAPLTEAVHKRWGRSAAWYRLLYNLFSLLTLLPLWAYTRSLSAGKGLLWGWPYTVIQAGLILLGLGLLWAGARSYDLAYFAGFRQIAAARSPAPKKAVPELKRTGVLGLIRHPWYSAALCLLWSQKMDRPTLVMTVVLSLYLVVGAFLEERKLVRSFGKGYRDYQRQVSMFFPVKWLRR